MTILMRRCSDCGVEKKFDDNPSLHYLRASGFRGNKCWECNLTYKALFNRKWRRGLVVLDTGEQLTRGATYNRNYRLDEMNKLRNNLSALLGITLRNGEFAKSATLHEYLNCTVSDLRYHLEDLFAPGMTWENQGSYWHVDHILPLSAVNNHDEFKALWHWTNLQPLEGSENISKGGKYNAAELAAFLASRSVQSPSNYIVT